MFIVTNTIQVKQAFLEQMVQKFRSTFAQEKMKGVPGFIQFEVLYRELPETPTIGEIVVVSRWDTSESQVAWTKSESFKALHPRRPLTTATADDVPMKKESPVIRNTVSRYFVAE